MVMGGVWGLGGLHGHVVCMCGERPCVSHACLKAPSETLITDRQV